MWLAKVVCVSMCVRVCWGGGGCGQYTSDVTFADLWGMGPGSVAGCGSCGSPGCVGGWAGGGEGLQIVDFFSADPSLDLWDMEPGSVAGKGSVGGCMYGGRGGGGRGGL